MRFMTGHTPSEFKTEAERQKPGTQKCIALVYEGVNAVRKIRDVLGPTDPSRRRPAPSAANSAPTSRSTPRTRAIRWKMPGARWKSSIPVKTISGRSSRNFTGSCRRAISPATALGGGKFKAVQFRLFNPLERRAIQRPRFAGNQFAGEKFQVNGLFGVGVRNFFK